MLHTVYYDPAFDDERIRSEIYDGQLIVFSPTAASNALAAFAREMLEDAFAPYHPTEAQYHMTVEKFVEIFAPVKPAFIHHPKTMGLIRDVFDQMGCDLDQWFIDVPRYRGVTSDGYLTTGVGYAHHPHRDTWFSAPMAQINWWMALYPYETSASMAYHPAYFDKPVANESDEFNYYEWNATGRKDAAKMIGKDTRKQPHATEPIEMEPHVRLVTSPGSLQGFSGAHLHTTMANVSGKARFSLDFRTVHLGDLRNGRSAPNVDSHSTGTSLRDFRRASDLAPMPDDVVDQYDVGAKNDDAVLVFSPDA
ncbi:MAG: phytanoyl-CoA dioxygenase family protein [Acidimicrobiia bacterium]